MTAIKTQLYWSLIVLILVLNISDSRYLKNENSKNDLTNQSEETIIEDEDIDLEAFSNDYYDDLRQHLESLIQSTEKALKKAKEKENRKMEPKDYDYLSDMPVAKPENEDRRFKVSGGNPTQEDKENFTWPFANTVKFNASSSSNGIPEALRAYRESNSQEEFPLRSKEMRIKSIKDQVLKFRGGSPRINETIPDVRQYNALSEIYEKNIKRIQNEEWTSPYTEKVQSFYPSCDIPRNTDKDVWSDTQAMNLLFDLDYPSPQEDSTIMIVSAKLRLYKLPQENYSSPVEGAFGKIKERTQNGFGVLPSDDDRQIRVSVYWYTKSLRSNRVKKKLLDSHMLPISAPKWVEFNVRPAVRTWKESSRNFGLVVNVEDEDGNLLPADQYIHSMNCSKWTANVRPIPSIVMDRVNQFFIENYSETKNETSEETKNEAETRKIYSFQPLLYPLIDLCTREVPNSEVTSIALLNSAKRALESEFLNLSRRGFNMGNDSVSIFLQKNNMDLRDISKLSRVDKSVPKKSEGRVSYFQNVPIGSPTTNHNSNALSGNKRGREASKEGEVKIKTYNSEAETKQEKEEERKMPRIRHNRKQWEMFQKTANSNSRSRNDFNATDHH